MKEVSFKRVRSWSDVIPKWLKDKSARKYLPIGENIRKWIWYNNNSNSKLYFIFRYHIRVGFIQIEKNNEYYDIAILVDRRFRRQHLATKSLKKLRDIYHEGTFRMSVQQCNSAMHNVLDNLNYVASDLNEFDSFTYISSN